ncbi:hypothetical protein QE429_004023 [Bacillus sp. SORGH_AS 510]|nr:hypothetical protein [Bacillus sp. SORGH_AS_0510]
MILRLTQSKKELVSFCEENSKYKEILFLFRFIPYIMVLDMKNMGGVCKQ